MGTSTAEPQTERDLTAALLKGAEETGTSGPIAAAIILTEYADGDLLRRPGLDGFLTHHGAATTVNWDQLYQALAPGVPDPGLDLNPPTRAALTLAAALATGRVIDRLGYLLAQFSADNCLVVLRAMWCAMNHGQVPIKTWLPPVIFDQLTAVPATEQ